MLYEQLILYELNKVKYLYIYIVGYEEKKIFTISQIESNTWKTKQSDTWNLLKKKKTEKKRDSHEQKKNTSN